MQFLSDPYIHEPLLFFVPFVHFVVNLFSALSAFSAVRNFVCVGPRLILHFFLASWRLCVMLLVQALFDRFDEERPGHGGIAENLGETAAILGSHELSPGNPLRISTPAQSTPVCWLRTYPYAVVKLF